MWGILTSPPLVGWGCQGAPEMLEHPQWPLTRGALSSLLSLGHGVCSWGPGKAAPSVAPSGLARLSSSKLVQAKVRFRVQPFGGGVLLGNASLWGLTHHGAEVVTGTSMARGQPPPQPQEDDTGLSPLQPP